MEIKLYTFSLLDHKGVEVIYSKKYASAKQAAYFGKQALDAIPPAMSFTIHLVKFKASEIAELVNNDEGKYL